MANGEWVELQFNKMHSRLVCW